MTDLCLCKNILVTGGTGYIGSHTVVELIEAGYRPVIIDNLSGSSIAALDGMKAITGQQVPFYEMDIRDESALTAVLHNENIEAVIHFAALKAVGESAELPAHYFDNNISGSIALIKAMETTGVQRIVFSSSASVYGMPKQLPISEQAPMHTLNPYGTTKVVVEQLLNDMATFRQWQVIHLRYFNPIGAHPSGQIGERVIGKPNNLLPFLCDVAKGCRPLLSIFGNDYPTPDGTCIRDYIHVVDLAKAHVAAMQKINQLTESKTYNLGTGKAYSVLELVHTFMQETGVTLPFAFAPRRPGDAPACYADPSLAKAELNWVAEHDLATMMRDTWRWETQ